MKDFRQLKVWGKAHATVLQTYRLLHELPADERFALAAQMRRAAVSIPSNIAEGCGRDSERDFSRFLKIAAGSASELEYQVLLAKDLGYIGVDAQADLDMRLNEVKRMLNSLIQKLDA
ncbi:MAG: four helix bundle protein [Pseudomonadota bacterium]|nr:four helix bundle protein [Pseudomonadota bacterium]